MTSHRESPTLAERILASKEDLSWMDTDASPYDYIGPKDPADLYNKLTNNRKEYGLTYE